MILLHKYLTEIGDKFDCYFTIESIGKEGVLNNQILDAMVEIDTNADQSLDSLVTFLKNSLVIQWKSVNETNMISIAIDRVEGRKPIIRLRDRRLAVVKNYVLDRKVGLQYEGAADGLIDSLAKVNANIRKQRLFLAGQGPIIVDHETQVRVSCTNKPIRDILTDCIPLPGYSRVIWSSYTDGKEESPSVIIMFYGARMKEDKTRRGVAQQTTNQTAVGVQQIPGSGEGVNPAKP